MFAVSGIVIYVPASSRVASANMVG